MSDRFNNIENLPYKESRKAYITRKYGDFWNLRRFDSPSYNSERSKDPFIIVDHVIKKFVGRSFDKAFRHYCSKVEARYQYIFLDELAGDIRDRWPNEYIVNEEGNIQINPEYLLKPWKCKTKHVPQSVTFQSFDYQTVYVNLRTGKEQKHLGCFDRESNFGIKIVSGFYKYFEDDTSKEYLRMVREDNHRRNLAYKRSKKYVKEYSFLTREEERLKKQKEEDLLKRDSHGFDEESFKGLEYHGQKRKLKNAA